MARRAKPIAVNVCHCGDHAWRPITKGYVALVSPEEADLLGAHSWSTQIKKRNIYVSGAENGKHVYLHRKVLPDAKIVDHRNGNGLDNRRENVRPASILANNRNTRRVVGVVPFRGVSLIKKTGMFKAEIRVRGQGIFLGHHTTAEQAADAYDLAAARYFGEFAATNRDIGLRCG